MYRIFVVEDDAVISRGICNLLGKWGFEARAAADFSNVLSEFETYSPHLAVIDISLPFYNGYYWCERMRAVSRAPIIFVSSHTENMDIVMAMNMGADDYITKPFSGEVLIAKINALLRRAYSYTGERPAIEVRGVLLEDGALSFEGCRLELTKNEHRVLKLLFSHKNTIVSRDAIMRSLWESESFIDDNTLTVNINRLRKKLADFGLEGLITTKRGEGYAVYDDN